MGTANTLAFELGAAGYDLLTRQELWRRQIASLLDHIEHPPTRILDLGCGPGVSSFVLAERSGAEVLGLDASRQMIRRATAAHAAAHPHLQRVRFQLGDARALALPDASFDLVTGHSFLYLVDDRAGVLREALRVLRPGGALVLMEPSASGALLQAAWGSRGELVQLKRSPWGAARFCTSMVLWRGFGSVAGMMSPALVEELFTAAGFCTIQTHPTLGGLGLHCVGRALDA